MGIVPTKLKTNNETMNTDNLSNENDSPILRIGAVMGSALFNAIGEWSKNALPDAGSIEHIIKLKHEAQEVIEAPYDIKEYADCFIALLAAAYKADIAFFELVEAVQNKLEVNKNRKWTKLSDGTYQHCP